jgi:hypothetical protein
LSKFCDSRMPQTTMEDMYCDHLGQIESDRSITQL